MSATPRAPLVPDRAAILDDLTFRYGYRDGFACVASGAWNPKRRVNGKPRPGLDGYQEVFFAWPAQREQAADYLERAAKAGKECYACGHLLTARSRKKEHAADVRVLYNDTDAGNVKTAHPPTRVVATSGYAGPDGARDSGSLRLQSYWALSRSVPPEQAEALNRRLAVEQGTDQSGSDLSQLLRVTGAFHGKTATRWAVVDVTAEVRLDAGDWEPYDPDALDAELPALPEPPSPLPPAPSGAEPLSDDDLLDLMLHRARNAPKARALWDGSLNEHDGDHSRADAALIQLLCFYSDDDDQVDRLFRRSALFREEKWGRRADYRAKTIAKARRLQTERYDPAHNRTLLALPAPAGDPCAGKDAEVARLKAERDEARRTVAMVVQTVVNPYLTPTEMRLQVSALSQAAAKRARGEVEPDGRVRLTPAEVGRDFRPKPEPGQPRPTVNPRDGSKPLVPRDEVKPKVEALAERGILRAKTRPVKRARADGSTYNDVDILVEVPDRLSDAYAASATWTPEAPKARAPYTRRRPCPSCGEAHPLTRTDACQGCGAVVARSTVQPPIETVEAEPEPGADAPLAGNNPPISYVTPLPVGADPLGRKKSSHSGDGESALVQRLRRDRATPADAIAARLRARASPNGNGRHEPANPPAGGPDADAPIDLFPPGRYADLTDAAAARAGP